MHSTHKFFILLNFLDESNHRTVKINMQKRINNSTSYHHLFNSHFVTALCQYPLTAVHNNGACISLAPTAHRLYIYTPSSARLEAVHAFQSIIHARERRSAAGATFIIIIRERAMVYSLCRATVSSAHALMAEMFYYLCIF